MNQTTTIGHNVMFNFTGALDTIEDHASKWNTIKQAGTIAVICLYIPVFLISLIGNSLVIYVVFKHSHMRRAKNLFLVNLAFADMAVTLLCMPMAVGEKIFHTWIYGQFMCKASNYTRGVAVSTSVLTLAVLSVDRYLAIQMPFATIPCDISNKKAAIMIILSTWLLSGVLLAPVLVKRWVFDLGLELELGLEYPFCVETWDHDHDKQVYSIVLMCLNYVVPVAVISVCYALIGRRLFSERLHRNSSDSSSTVMLGRKRVARMLIAVTVVFIACWLPYNICSLIFDIGEDILAAKVLPFTLMLGHAHSALNPILYCLLNKSFRHSMRKAATCQLLRSSRRGTPFLPYV